MQSNHGPETSIVDSVQKLFEGALRSGPDGNHLTSSGEQALRHHLTQYDVSQMNEALRHLQWLSLRAAQNGDAKVKSQVDGLLQEARDRARKRLEAGSQHLESAARIFGHAPRRAPSAQAKKPQGAVSVSSFFPRRV